MVTRPRRPWDRDPQTEPALTKPTFDLSANGGGSVGATVRGLENKWQRAIAKHDVNTIDKLIADDFAGKSSSGKAGSKSSLMSHLRSDRNVYTTATAQGIKVRVHGGKIAVVTGVSKQAGTAPGGKRFTVSRRFTDTWTERNGRWQCIASKSTQLPGR